MRCEEPTRFRSISCPLPLHFLSSDWLGSSLDKRRRALVSHPNGARRFGEVYELASQDSPRFAFCSSALFLEASTASKTGLLTHKLHQSAAWSAAQRELDASCPRFSHFRILVSAVLASKDNQETRGDLTRTRTNIESDALP